MILCKSPEQAKEFYETAQRIANEFQLALNQEKTQLLDLVEGFDFLGFRFQRKQAWQTSSGFTVAHVDEIGWQQQTKQQKAHIASIALPGESKFPSRGVASTVILGPHVRSLDAEGKSLRYARADGKFQSIGPLTSVENVLVLGKANVSSQLVGKLAQHDVDLLMTDDIGRPLLRLGQGSPLSAELVRQQVLHSTDLVIRQFLSFELLHAKISNYAALADGCRERDRRQTGDDLRAIAKRMCHSQSVAELRGHEGHAAAIWYGRLKNRVASSHVFARRISPNAEDPINILLNLGFTQLYRLTEGLLEVNGLVPAIGFLHDDRSGHQSLASDIMEPFRFLVERAVIEASAKIRPKDFRESNGPYPVNITAPALREFQRILFQTFSLGVSFEGNSAPITYRMQIARVVRQLKRFLLDTRTDFVVPEFRHEGSQRTKPKSIQ